MRLSNPKSKIHTPKYLRLCSLLLIQCFLVNALPWPAVNSRQGRHLEWAWAGRDSSSAVEEFLSRSGPSSLRPRSNRASGEFLDELSGDSAQDGGRRLYAPLKKSEHFLFSYPLLGRGLLTDIEGEKLEIYRGRLIVDEEGELGYHPFPNSRILPSENLHKSFIALLNQEIGPYRKTRELFTTLARHHTFRFARGMKTLLRRESRNHVLIHEALADPANAPPADIFWEFWVTLFRSSAIRHDPELVGNASIGFTPQVFGLLGEVGRLLLIEKPKREKLKEYLMQLSDKGVVSIDKDFLNRYMETVDDIEEAFARNFADLSRGTRPIYTDFVLSLAIPPLVRLLNPKGWPDEEFSDFVLPQEFRVRLSTELKRLRRAEEFQRVIRTIDGEGDARVPETAVVSDIKGDARALRRLLQRALERDAEKVIVMGDSFGKSHGRSLEGISPLTVYDYLRDFEEMFQGRGVYLFGPDDIVFLFTMMNYPGLEKAWFTIYGGEELLEARNKEIRKYNEEQKRLKREEAELLPELTLNNFRNDPRLKEISHWMKNRFYIYHLDEFGVLYVAGGLPGAQRGKAYAQIAKWARLEELIRTEITFKARVFEDILDETISPILLAGWKEESEALNIAEFLLTIRVDGEGGREVVAVMTSTPNFNHGNMSFGNDFDAQNAEGGPGVALRFVGRNGVVLDRFQEGRWETTVEETPDSFQSRVYANAARRIKVVSAALPREDEAILSLLKRREAAEESEELRFVKQVKKDLVQGAKLSDEVKVRLMDIAEKVLYGGKMQDRYELSLALGIQNFLGNIVYNENTGEAVLLVGKERLGSAFIAWSLVGEKKPGTDERLYPGWVLLSQATTQLFSVGTTLFGGTQPVRYINPKFRELYFTGIDGKIRRTGILPQQKVVEISRIVFLTDEAIAKVGPLRALRLISEKKDPHHQKLVEAIEQLQERAHLSFSEETRAALMERHIEKFHVGVFPETRIARLPQITRLVDADVGRHWMGARLAAMVSAVFPPGVTFYQALREFRRNITFRPEERPESRLKEKGGFRGPEDTSQDGEGKRVEKRVKVGDAGLHARPIGLLVKEAHRFQSEIRLSNLSTNPDEEVDAKSTMQVMMLAAAPGEILKVVAVGPDAEEAARAMEERIIQPERSSDGGEKKAEGTVVVKFHPGIHARMAALIVKMAQKFPDTTIWIENLTEPLERPVNAKSIMSVMMLGAAQHHEVRIIAEGEQAKEAVQEMTTFIRDYAEDGGHKAEDAVVMQDPGGIHGRRAARIAHAARNYPNTVIRLVVMKRETGDVLGEVVDAKLPWKVNEISAEEGDTIKITAEGEDAEAAVAAIKAEFSRSVPDGGRRGGGVLKPSLQERLVEQAI